LHALADFAARTWPRWRMPCATLAAVLVAHALLLGLWPRVPGPGWRTQTAPRLTVRQVVQRAALPALPATAAAPLRAAPDAARVPATQPVAAAPAPPASTATQAPPAPDPGGLEVPVYATVLPPSATLRYRLQRGSGGGRAELQWALAEDGSYLLALQIEPRGAVASGWTSTGRIDAHGLAPDRAAESQRGRDRRAVHFQRGVARITFSGPQLEYPLLPGAQDRLSWMVQLPAIVAAEPALATPGREVLLFVVGVRGDAGVWTFTAQGRETLALADEGATEALHFRRLPQRPYDTQVDVWLDPARHHLPVRTTLLVRPTGERSDLLLEVAP
jgi:hypothetical protein